MAGRIQQGEFSEEVLKLTEEEKRLIKRDMEKGITMAMFRQQTVPLALQLRVIRQWTEPKSERVFVHVSVIMETRQVAWTDNKTSGVLDLHEIREVRRGNNSNDFNQFKNDKTCDEKTCFTIFYGSQFVLNTLSLQADKEEDAKQWRKGLELLRQETLKAPTPDIIKSWLRKQMYSINPTKKDSIRMKDLKSLLPQLNLKVPDARFLKDTFLEIGAKKDVLNFEQFHKLYNILMFESQKSIMEVFDKDPRAFIMGLPDFQTFLLDQQKESWANDQNQVRELMTTFIDDTRKTNDPWFTVGEFLNFLYSKENSIWDEKFSEVCDQDMEHPLSHYWINTSHNTYLTGDQIKSESSTEAYVRCLRMGCRCIELDCWDGDKDKDGRSEPIIYHGYTRTTMIKFEDVVKVINEHAFVKSEYPLVLSIEQHCKIENWGQMAKIFRDEFKDKLLTEPMEPNAYYLPSPKQLKGKIIIKHKIAEDGEVEHPLKVEMQGYLHIWDPVDQQWNRHFSMISDDKLYYMEEEEEEEDARKGMRPTELHYVEPWFHGLISEGRQMAERLLQEFCAVSGGLDGTFLVRESNTLAMDHVLTCWLGGRVQHCLIRSRSEDGHKVYFLNEKPFSSVYELIEHYRQNPFLCKEFDLQLTDAVPCPNQHLKQKWFYSNLCREEAEDMLMRIPRDGAFLIRQSESDCDSFAITFRGDSKVKHCRIEKEGSMFVLGSSAVFESLVELVNYFRKKPFYRKIKLRYPVTKELLTLFSMEKISTSIYEQKMYVDPNEIEPSLSTVKALYEYAAGNAEELSFPEGALIHNVTKDTSGWWKGDYGGKLQLLFPANYVKEVSINEKEESKDQGTEDNPLGVLCKGVVELSKCSVVRAQQAKNGMSYVFTLQLKDDDTMLPLDIAKDDDTMLPLDIATDSVEDLFEWYQVACGINKSSKQNEKKKSAWFWISGEKRKSVKTQEVRNGEIAKSAEMSKLVVYCMPCKKNCFGLADSKGHTYKEIHSIEENKELRVNTKLLKYNRKSLSRIYPNGVLRVDSSNCDPYPYWLCGCHMVALNFQTGDRAMQLNSALFSLNGQTGYVLQPEMMRSGSYDPCPQPDKEDPKCIITVRVIAARHLPKPGCSIVSPFVEVELCGFNGEKCFKTIVLRDNGLNPVWPPTDPVQFMVYEPELTFLRFVVNEEDMFSDPSFVAQATFPIKGIRSGYRSVPLKNEFSEPIELASLLVYVDVNPPLVQDKGKENKQ